jgi:hypothetical protein
MVVVREVCGVEAWHRDGTTPYATHDAAELRDRKKHFAFDSTAYEMPSFSHLFACSPAILG